MSRKPISMKRLAGLVALLSATAAPASDLILVNGRIYTAGTVKWAEAIAITGDKIDKVGSTKDVLATKTASTKVVDLKGRMVIPGITDDHVHIWFGSLALNSFNFSTPESNITPEADRALFIAKIKDYAAANKDKPMLFGRSAFSRGSPDPGPGLAILDEAVPDKPLIIHHTSEHALYINSKALALVGITDKPLPNPKEEMFIERDAHGHPTGLVRETAMDVVERNLPRMAMDDQVRILAEGTKFLNSFGVTSAVALTGGLDDLKAYEELRKRGLLTLRIRQGFASVAVNQQLTPKFLADLETARTTWHDDWLSANIVKFFMDGAPTPPLYEVAEYNKILTELDKRGFQLTSHALSTAGAKMALNGYQAILDANGPRDRRSRIEHASMIEPVDLPRFGQLGVIPSTQPAFCCSPDRPSNPWNSFIKTGATLVFSSDWPCSWPPSPMMGIQQAATRAVRRPVTVNGPKGEIMSDNMPDERVTPEQALLAYTKNSAYANKMEAKLGTLEAGKLADLVVLSQDILAAPVETIGQTQVIATVVGGRVVYGSLP
ncbi:amidohydrolase [soil metagenome]